MFISNNRASLHLWWKENLEKHQKVSEYYENDCSLKSENDLLDIGKLETTPVNLRKLSDAVKMKLLKRLYMLSWLKKLILFRP